MQAFKRHFLSIDPRTLGFTRILLALLLMLDLGKRWIDIALWFDEHGLIPTGLALTSGRTYKFSLFFAFNRWEEAAVAFALCGLCYLALLFGYRTRLAQLGSLVAILSLNTRVDLLSNGGDFVLCILCWWTLAMPLGQRFSVDALQRSFRQRPETALAHVTDRAGLQRPVMPFVSVAVLAALLQISIIYLFNTLHKNGPTWSGGTAIYYLTHQERLVDGLGVWMRHNASLSFTKALTYGALAVEGSLPLLILSPWGKPWTRRLAILFVVGLHASIELVGNFGLFSLVMMVFSSLLMTGRDWDDLERRARARPGRARTLFFDSDCGVCFQSMRLLIRLDLFERITPAANTDESQLPADVDRHLLERTMLVVDPASGRRWTGAAAWAQVIGALPLGRLVAWLLVLPGLRQLVDAAYLRFALNRTAISVWLGLAACGLPGAKAQPLPAAAPARTNRLLGALRELFVVYLMVVATSQVLVENWILPQAVRVKRLPVFLEASVSYTRLQQGWSMFSSNAPMNEMSLVVDAVTKDGRHVDPLNEVAMDDPDPRRRTVPVFPDYNVYWVDYVMRIPHTKGYHNAMRKWLERYHERTGNPQDKLVGYQVYIVSQDSPAPGQGKPTVKPPKIMLQRRGIR